MSMLKRKPTIPYGKQEITQEDINAVVETLKGDFLTQGPKIKAFEDFHRGKPEDDPEEDFETIRRKRNLK